jgi:hypothetical protein
MYCLLILLQINSDLANKVHQVCAIVHRIFHSCAYGMLGCLSVGESAKGLIYLTDAPTAVTRREVPEKSVTRQLSRGYDWSSPGIDPRTHRFGVVARDGLVDGVAQSIRQIRTGDTKIGISYHDTSIHSFTHGCH